MDSSDLLNIAYSDVRRIEKRDVEKYLGIEREISPQRVKELKEYVKNIDATFPSSIIIAVDSMNAKYDKTNKLLSIKNEPSVAKIIDGQHRIAGLEAYGGAPFQLIVTLFIDMELEDQAMVFATINLKQTKVSKSLAYDLYEYTKSRSPQKTCHNIVKLMNNAEGSPFKGKIKILGIATGEPQESITQATFVERLLRYISKNANADRDLIKRGKKIEEVKGKERDELIFRNLFRADKDAYIAKNLWNYFAAVKQKWPTAWQQVKRGNILNRTTGFVALMRFLRDTYISYGNFDEVYSTKEYYSKLEPISINDDDFNPEIFKPGSSGEKELYEKLIRLSRLGN
jgi:DGQHR domain-containing protein